MVFLQRLLVGFDDIHPDEVGVALIPFSVHQTLQEDLDETETSAGEGRRAQNKHTMEEKTHINQSDCFGSAALSSTIHNGAHRLSHIRAKVAPTLGH